MTMTIEFKAVTLDSGTHDNQGMLVFRDGRLMAVLSCLSDIHGAKEGQWFVEMTFTAECELTGQTFGSLGEAEIWASS